MTDDLKERALEYHRVPTSGKIEVVPTKPLTTQSDLALAYSPGVAAACEAIVEDPEAASSVTARGNLVAVISNGTAVLGLGSIGALASKPVMEGKGVLFKKFAGVDVFDLEIAETDPDKLVDIIESLAPTFGGINLEDIKAPECFFVERELRKRLDIPVFHDDQHGTAIITAAAVLNALSIVGKSIEEVRLVTSGAGAAGMACLDLLVNLGMTRSNIIVTDRKGVVYVGREAFTDGRKAEYAAETQARTLADAVSGADIFLGVSAGGILSQDMVKTMADKPIILALANPDPEITPEDAKAARPDVIIATGRSDYPNQVNNVLCFPYIFRGALDVGASTINEEMKMACVRAIADLTKEGSSDLDAYKDEAPKFGPEYLIPKPFDPRLHFHVAPAVAQAAMDSGVARRPIADMAAYRERLSQFVFQTGLVMKPIFDAAKADLKRVVFAEGEEPTTLRAVKIVIDDGLAIPILVGRPEVVQLRIEQLGLDLEIGRDFELVNPESDPRYREYWTLYHSKMRRRGVTVEMARTIVRTSAAVIAALMVDRGEADAMLGGLVGRYRYTLQHITDVLGLREGISAASSLSAIATGKRVVFISDAYVNPYPKPQQMVDSVLMAIERLQAFRLEPRVALLSHSNFGSHTDEGARRMQEALSKLHEIAPDLQVDGEMHANAALSEEIRERIFPGSRLKGEANMLVMPSIDAANIALSMGRALSEGVTIGPMLMGIAKPAHILTTSATIRRVVNMTAIAAVDAQREARRAQEGNQT